ncbi:MAG: site-specific integrase [Trebonia sp.]
MIALQAAPELLGLAVGRLSSAAVNASGKESRPAMTALAPILQSFFTDKLARQRQASPRTVTAYRDDLRLLVQFASLITGTEPWQLHLDHLEADRGNSARTRNARLAAIRSCSATLPGRHPSTPRPSSASWPSPASALAPNGRGHA